MVKKSKITTEAKSSEKTEKKTLATEKMTSVTFRTRLVQKKKAEKIFEDMGINTSAALNMFLAQVVRDKGMPFLPSAKKSDSAESKPSREDMEQGFLTLEELWDEL